MDKGFEHETIEKRKQVFATLRRW